VQHRKREGNFAGQVPLKGLVRNRNALALVLSIRLHDHLSMVEVKELPKLDGFWNVNTRIRTIDTPMGFRVNYRSRSEAATVNAGILEKRRIVMCCAVVARPKANDVNVEARFLERGLAHLLKMYGGDAFVASLTRMRGTCHATRAPLWPCFATRFAAMKFSIASAGTRRRRPMRT
jgi:hypothetical protein